MEKKSLVQQPCHSPHLHSVFSGTLIPQSGMIRMSNCLKSKEYKILVHLRGVRGMKSKNSHRRRKAKRISYIYNNDSVIFHR